MKTTTNFGLKKPEENEFYDVNVQNENMDDIDRVLQEFKDGTQQVGDSTKLGGKDASEYAEKTELYNHAIPIYTVTTEEAMTEAYDGSHTNNEDATFYKAEIFHRVSHPILGSGTWYLEGFRINANYGWQSAKQYDATTTKVYYRSINNGAFGEWKRDAIGDFLPLSGGTLSKASPYVLKLQNTTEGEPAAWISYYGKNSILGSLGFFDVDRPIFYKNDFTQIYDLLHTGNKPTCTYTGNGDASNFRLVATGGIGDGCIVRSSNGVAIVTGSCVSILSGNSAVTDNSATWQNGELGMFSNHSVLNAIGVIYTCHVI